VKGDRDGLRSMAGLLRRLLSAHGSGGLPRAGLGADGGGRGHPVGERRGGRWL